MSTPASVLLARALYFLESAQLQLQADQIDGAADSMDKATALLKEIVV